MRLAGLDHRPLYYSADPVEVAVEQAVALDALKRDREYSEQRDANLAIAIGNRVGNMVGQALVSIAAAMRQ